MSYLKVREYKMPVLKASLLDKKPVTLSRAIATLNDMYHPYFEIRMKMGVPTVIPCVDNWLQCQIDAGLVKLEEEMEN